MPRPTPHVMAYFLNSPWSILPSKFHELSAVLIRRMDAFNRPPETRAAPAPSASAFRGSDQERGYSIVGNVAVITIHGTITPRPSLFEEYSGGTSHEAIGRATDAAVADGKCESILYDLDSPGGVVFGMPEGSEKVASASKRKPTTGVANFCAASAAYWYLSQCKEAVCAPSGTVGCLGCLMANVDETRALEMAGVRADLIANDSSPFKTEGYPQVPVTAEGLADLKTTCNAYAAMFTNAVAAGRGKSAAVVNRDFGKGRMLLAKPALAVGMVDRIETIGEALTRLSRPSGRNANRDIAVQMVRAGLPTA